MLCVSVSWVRGRRENDYVQRERGVREKGLRERERERVREKESAGASEEISEVDGFTEGRSEVCFSEGFRHRLERRPCKHY